VPPDADVKDIAQPTTVPWNAPTITMDIQDLPKDEVVTTYLSLLHNLYDNPYNIITYTDSSQLSTQTGTGFYIPIASPTPSTPSSP
jgi:hypothetical protein